MARVNVEQQALTDARFIEWLAVEDLTEILARELLTVGRENRAAVSFGRRQ